MKIHCDEGIITIDDEGKIVHATFVASWLQEVDCICTHPDTDECAFLADCVIVWLEPSDWWDEDSGISNQFLWCGLAAVIFLSLIAGIVIGVAL